MLPPGAAWRLIGAVILRLLGVGGQIFFAAFFAMGAGLVYCSPMNNQDSIREQIDFNTKLLQIGFAFLALIGSGLIAQIKTGMLDMLFWAGVGSAVILLVVVGLLIYNTHRHIKTLRQPK